MQKTVADYAKTALTVADYAKTLTSARLSYIQPKGHTHTHTHTNTPVCKCFREMVLHQLRTPPSPLERAPAKGAPPTHTHPPTSAGKIWGLRVRATQDRGPLKFLCEPQQPRLGHCRRSLISPSSKLEA